MSKGITLKTIAEKTNVSIGTVARALNNRGRIKSETRDRILKEAKELGYTPNTFARALSSSRRYNVLAVVPREPSNFFEMIIKGMRDAALEMEKLKVDVEFIFPDKLDSHSQIAKIKDIDPSGIDGIVINPASCLLKDYINTFVDVGVPVITYNSDIENSKRLCYIGQNMRDAGQIAGELMGKFVCGEGKVAILTPDLSIQSLTNRVEGFKSVIANDFPKIEIMQPQEYTEDMLRACDMAYSLANDPSICGIFVTSSAGTEGVAMAMEKTDPQKRPVVVGFDSVKRTRQALLNNEITATISQEPYAQGYYSIRFMAKRLLEGWQPKRELFYTITKISLKYYNDEEEIKVHSHFE